MATKVTWAPRALEDYFNVLEYLRANWSSLVVNNFIDKTDEIIGLIASEGIVFRKYGDINEVLITKHNLLLYRRKKNELEILAIFDTRRHPKKKKI